MRVTICRRWSDVVLKLAFFALFSGGVATVAASSAAADDDDEFWGFDDQPVVNEVEYPDWFENSFLVLQEDLQEVIRQKKKGLVVYFGQKHCAYCYKLMNTNLKQPDIANYMRANFNVVPLNIWDIDTVTDLQGRELSVHDYAVRENTNFTPSLIFYDTTGKEVFRLRGYYPPYKFRAALEYVADGYYKTRSFRDYLRLADFAENANTSEMNPNKMFLPPPYALDRSKHKSSRPLAVFFEQGNCHTCDVLHAEPLNDERIEKLLRGFELVQLDMWSDVPVITPSGRHTTARRWAAGLGLFYAPSIVFFDESGYEVFRVDSLVSFFRLSGVLQYILDKGYQYSPTYSVWRANKRLGFDDALDLLPLE